MVCTHGNFIVLPHWGTRPISNVVWYSTEPHFPDNEPTSSWPLQIILCSWLGRDKYKFYKSLVWLDDGPESTISNLVLNPFTQGWWSLKDRWAMKKMVRSLNDLSKSAQRSPRSLKDLSKISQGSPQSTWSPKSFDPVQGNRLMISEGSHLSKNAPWPINVHSMSAQRSQWSFNKHQIFGMFKA